ncbi:dTDP-4-dehydrorhamnose 3,5-epimerase [Desulfonatronospira thiodismutans ASO3-1]|uniref:dTDP-4-dehydrorhamnose 3,5-epimerase n=1 Tax=Desulfonatronospira thiodismutans ASO3-1 TaxID=555779 RepID=D6SKT7_9BACT|nr:dTDP-4-dehydrorhamnose 3,5-epimerase [Desulfonatronospira thiodismutans]EFI35298.1 dTDP-4-dehydrorhamnose 3,5-epimerase [Desulfonatronospira thiodismutans ASO3-1]
MDFIPTTLNGAYLIRLERHNDDRGFFSRTFCRREFEKMGLNSEISQCNLAFNNKAGTLRGMHFQTQPYSEVKLVGCVSGSVFDVIIDLREESTTYSCWFGTKLSADNLEMLYVPKGFAHGYQTLVDNAAVSYMVSESYCPEYENGVRWNDPVLNISWPLEVITVSKKDSAWPLLNIKKPKDGP